MNNTRGNAAYTIEEPEHYPFAYSDNPVLQWINNTLVKAKPEMHKKTFLKPVIKDVEVLLDLPQGRIALRAEPLQGLRPRPEPSRPVPALGRLGPWGQELLLPAGRQDELHRVPHGAEALDRLRRQGLRWPGRPRDPRPPLHRRQHGPGRDPGRIRQTAERHARVPRRQEAPDRHLRPPRGRRRSKASCWARSVPRSPRSSPAASTWSRPWSGRSGIGHLFSQGTVDSNEIWVELIARSGGRVIGHSGGIGPDGSVDPYSHFINVYMLDRDGNRIDRRNPQDIFVPLYNKQIPPGAGQVVHFGLEVPAGEKRADHARGQGQLPQVRPDLHGLHLRQGEGARAADRADGARRVQLPVEGGQPAKNDPRRSSRPGSAGTITASACSWRGGTKGGQKGELKQAEEIFRKVAELGPADGWVNLARVYQKEGRIPEALGRAGVGRATQGAGRALGHQLAHRPDQRPQRPAR